MAARKNVTGAPRRNTPLYIDDRWKTKIQAGVLIERLRRFAKSKFNPTSDDYMAPHQVQAASILLKKVIPDLAAVEHKGEVQIRPIIDPEPTAVEWKETFAEIAAGDVAKAPEFDRTMTEEDLLKGLEGIEPPKADGPSAKPPGVKH